jgi:hypothetical protein
MYSLLIEVILLCFVDTRLHIYIPYTVYLYSITQVLVLVAINNHSVIYANQRDVQDKKTNFVVSQKATTPCAGNDQFAIVTLIRNLLGNATNKQIVPKLYIPAFQNAHSNVSTTCNSSHRVL